MLHFLIARFEYILIGGFYRTQCRFSKLSNYTFHVFSVKLDVHVIRRNFINIYILHAYNVRKQRTSMCVFVYKYTSLCAPARMCKHSVYANTDKFITNEFLEEVYNFYERVRLSYNNTNLCLLWYINKKNVVWSLV